MGWLNNRNLLFHSSGVKKSKIKVPSELVSGEDSPPGLQMATFSVCLSQLPDVSSYGFLSVPMGVERDLLYLFLFS